MYVEQRVIQASEIGYKNHIRIKDLVDIIQDIEARHIESLEKLSKAALDENFSIPLNFRFIHIKSWPTYGDEVTLKTFPFKTNKYFGYRNTIIFDKEEPIIESYCLGSFINLKTLTPHQLSKEVVLSIKDLDRYPMIDVGRKIIDDRNKVLINETVLTVNIEDIDYYKHMNNAVYVNIAANQLPIDYNYEYLACEYRFGFLLNEKIKIKTFRNENSITVIFYGEENRINALIQFINKL